MQENLPPNDPNVNPTENPNARHSLGVEKSLSDRILAYAFGASVLINIGWMVAVSNSDIFGKGGVIPPPRETQIKVFKRPPPPKPKLKKPPPPPPPPKQQPHVKPPPLLIHHSPPPPPTPHMVVSPVRMSFRSASNIALPPAPPAVGPVLPAEIGPVTTPPAPPAPPVVAPTPPAPPVVLPPPPAPPVVAPPPPPPRLPPPPPPKPKNWVPIASQEADFPTPSVDIDTSEGVSGTVIISFTIDETGRPRNPRVKQSCGNTEVDNKCLEAIREARGTPAIQDHIPHDQPYSVPFNVGGG